MSTEALIATIVVAIVVLLVAVYAVAKGRGFKFAAQRGDTKLEMDIAGEQNEASTLTGGPGNISDVSVLDQGKISNSGNVNIHIGHQIEKKKE